jgi:hypothetical protein
MQLRDPGEASMRITRDTLFLACFAVAAPCFAQVPPTMIASLGKQILQNLIFGSVKSELIGGLANMGCKGAAIAGLAAAANAGGSAGAARALTGGARPPSPTGAAMRSAGPGGMPVGMGGMGGMGAMDPAMMQKAMEMAQQQAGARGRPAMTPEQQAMMQSALAQMQGAMSQPLSREETNAVFDEMAEVGLLSDSMRNEAKDCVTYAAPGAGDQIGVAGAMLKNTVLPAAGQAKERMAAATPEEQSQLADAMVEALNSASAADRKAFFDGLGLGFFPPQVVEQVRARVKP